MDATPEPMIRLDGVSKKYDDGTVAVHDLDLDVPEGETVVLVGPSGCGKSTTLKMVNRLIEPTSGRILLEGEDVTHVDPVKLRRRMGYVIQQTGLFPHQTIAANVATVPKLLGWDRKKVDARVHELLELVGLDPTTLRQALPPPALRRPAPAGRGGPRARRRPAGAADGRAVRRGRPDRARAAAGRVHPAAARGAQDGAVRDARPRRGGADGRPDRGVLARAATSSSTTRRPGCSARRPPSSSPSFVGADRGLKRLSVTDHRAADLEHPPVVHVDDRVADATAALRAAGARWGVVLDDEDGLHGWISADEHRRRDRADRARRMDAWVPVGASLKMAFAEMLQHDAGWVAVLDGDRYVGVLTPATLHEALRRSVESDVTRVDPEAVELETVATA